MATLAVRPSSPLRVSLRAKVNSAPHIDVVEMRIEKTACSLSAAIVHLLKELIVGVELAADREGLARKLKDDAMQLDPAVLPRPSPVRQLLLLDQVGDEIDRTTLRNK